MKILICLDISTHPERVLQASKLLLGIRMPQPEVVVLHVVNTSTLAGQASPTEGATILQEDSREIYAMAKDILETGFQYVEEYGIPQPTIDRFVNNTSYDLIIVGTRGRSLLANAMVGSIAEHLLHHAQIPIMIVP